jgi:hypothetical protein
MRIQCRHGYAGHGRGQRLGNLLAAFAARLPRVVAVATIAAPVCRQVSILSALAATGMLRLASRRLRSGVMTGAKQLQMTVGAVTRRGRQIAEDRQENHPRDECGSQLFAKRRHEIKPGQERTELTISYVIGPPCQLRPVRACGCYRQRGGGESVKTTTLMRQFGSPTGSWDKGLDRLYGLYNRNLTLWPASTSLPMEGLDPWCRIFLDESFALTRQQKQSLAIMSRMTDICRSAKVLAALRLLFRLASWPERWVVPQLLLS